MTVSGDVTHYYVCDGCGKACDMQNQEEKCKFHQEHPAVIRLGCSCSHPPFIRDKNAKPYWDGYQIGTEFIPENDIDEKKIDEVKMVLVPVRKIGDNYQVFTGKEWVVFSPQQVL